MTLCQCTMLWTTIQSSLCIMENCFRPVSQIYRARTGSISRMARSYMYKMLNPVICGIVVSFIYVYT